jgi:hypothetical protein
MIFAELIDTLRRSRPLQDSSKRAHVVDCRHVIHALRKKPMVLLNQRSACASISRKAKPEPWAT